MSAQRPIYGKMSPLVRQIVREAVRKAPSKVFTKSPTLCAFLRIDGNADEVLSQNGCRSLAHAGNIHIADIPVNRLGSLSLDPRVLRIEANRGNSMLNDMMAQHLNAQDAYEGLGLPQAYTGKDVVVGVMDIGFDLTHPTFYSRDTTQYRIHRLWDMLSQDTVGSSFYVGRDYTTRDELLQLGCCRDGRDFTHGTHTLGTAAGSGYDSNYQGMAPESDICIVANAVSDDIVYIDSADVYKYTFATDALGFKYIFDYAQSVGKPCVISFSEGSGQDFWGYDQLYYEMIDSLVGPGRILVSAAGNLGRVKSWLRKPVGQTSAGTFLTHLQSQMMLTFKSSDDFDVRLVSYASTNDTLVFRTSKVIEQEDSVLTMAVRTDNSQHTLALQIEAYPSCYHPEETCYDMTIVSDQAISRIPLSIEVINPDADIEVYRVNGVFSDNELNTSLQAGECSHNIVSPASAPCVICVGSTMYRQGIFNYNGKWKYAEEGPGEGERCTASSIGPTFDGRIKPDVMAPGVNIISSYSSYYLENHPDASDIDWDVAHFDFNGRTYVWNSNSGTSMSCPAVAGAIALWLQANPLLSPDDVMGVIERTSHHYDPSLTYPNNEYGYGEIDVYAGLLDILSFNKIKEISTRQTAAQVRIADGCLHITLPEAVSSTLHLRIFNLSGMCVVDRKLKAGHTTYSVPLQLRPAVYAVQIDGEPSLQGSSLIRIQ